MYIRCIGAPLEISMATVDESLAKQIIAKNGYYADDPRVVAVISYDNFVGVKSWAILYEQDVLTDRYQPSMYVRNPKVEWTCWPN